MIVIASINAWLQYISIEREIVKRQTDTSQMSNEEDFLISFYKPFLWTSRANVLLLHRQWVAEKDELIITFPEKVLTTPISNDSIDVESHIAKQWSKASWNYILNTIRNNLLTSKR